MKLKLRGVSFCFHASRIKKSVQVLDHCEIPPIRTEFVEELGQGAFGKVHKAKLKDGLEYFRVEEVSVYTRTGKQKTVAVKELHGRFEESGFHCSY